ncbi:signal transduction histidine kinase [Hoeflea sp. IMCC20628]|uniref:ATP-binding protein n=1 Tax=Hoeflea sp. IMCC20628 TaxID=1620421 RepID=UPI00063BD976|nr:ATP-binding protein [Hoeflea sp. IMCC20628]AKI00730.1 signal transduction histidine kinase [Hoeflea sp. IMCC20628]
MNRLKHLLPDSLAGRLVFLLAIAIIAANIIALAVLAFQQQSFDQQAREEREIERIAALIPAMEAVNAQLRQVIARDASTRFARVRVEDAPLLTETATGTRSRYIASQLAETLGRQDVIVAIIDRPLPPGADRNGATHTDQVIAITIPLSARNGQPEWLNVVTNGAPSRAGRIDSRPFLTVLSLSLLSVLGVAIVLARHLTQPLSQLSQAAEAAGRGDRTARVPEEGAREMRQAARAFNAMQAEISQFDAERMRMLAAVGHDLRTPMTSLRIRAEMVDDDELRDAMVRTLEEMTVMADGLISYARDGQDAEAMAPLDLARLLRQLCEDRGATCNVTENVQITGRRVSLGRAIGNLLDNALRYGDEARMTLAQDKKHAIVTIEDNGPGIPPDRLNEMFQPFTRGDDSRSLETGGAGLGLSISRTIIVAHGGQVTLENRADGGLRATVALPLANRT